MKTTPTSLGSVVRIYAPIPWQNTLFYALVIGSFAALGWYVMHYTDGHWYNFLIGLVTVGLSLFGLQLLFRVLMPNKKIIIYENGIAIGRKRILWSSIENVEYHYTLPKERNESIEHHWLFVLKDKREINLTTNQYNLDHYINLDEMESYLKAHVSNYNNLHQPKIKTEQISQRSPEQLITLPNREAIKQSIEKPPPPWSSVLKVLQQGYVRRQQHIRKSQWKSALIYFVHLATEMMIRILVLASVLAGIVLLVQLSDDLFGDNVVLSRVFSFSNILNYILLVLGTILGVFLAIRLEPYMKAFQIKANQYRFIAKQLKQTDPKNNTEELSRIKEKQQPFALYLRSFSAEYFQYVETSYDIDEHADITVMTRPLDTYLVNTIAQQLPLFALANINDTAPPNGMLQLFTQNEDWMIVADELIRTATLVIVYLNEATPSLLRELTILDLTNSHNRTLLVLGKTIKNKQLSNELEKLLKRFSHQTTESPSDIEAVATQLLKQLANL